MSLWITNVIDEDILIDADFNQNHCKLSCEKDEFID